MNAALLTGIDQLEVVSDGDGSVYETPEGSVDGADDDLDIGSMVEVVIKEVPRQVELFIFNVVSVGALYK